MSVPNLNAIPPLKTELKEFQQFVIAVQRKYSQAYKEQLSNMDAYFLALYLVNKYTKE